MKKTCGILAAMVAVFVIGASTASAQDSPKAGITMSTGSSIGVYIPIGDAAALRPTVGFSRSQSDYDGVTFANEELTTTSLTVGASVLFYVKSWDATRLYLSPQYSFARAKSSGNDDRASTGHALAAMIGAEHTFGSRFGVFAESGFGWSRSRNPLSSQLDESSITTTVLNTRATIGAVLFF